MSIDVSKGKEAVAGLVDSLQEYSNEKVTFVNTTDLREALQYIQLLEEKAEVEEVDNVSDLKVGDQVKTLIDYSFIKTGALGVVETILPEEYPVKVRFKGHAYSVGYKRFELGKV